MLPQDFLGMNVRKDNAAERRQDGRVQCHDAEMENPHSKGKEESMHVLKGKDQNYLSTFPILRCQGQGKDKERGEWEEDARPCWASAPDTHYFDADSQLLHYYEYFFTSPLFVLKNLAGAVQQLDLLHVTF